MNKKLFILVLIVVLGLLVRVLYITQIPPGLNRDEASIGYTAYSLLKTGNDEYGISYPLSFKSFGDWKLPFYIYLTIPFVKLFDLSDLAVRLPSVIFSVLTIIVCFFLAKKLFASEKIAFLSSFFFALSPWSIHLGRNASESTVAVFFSSLGLLFFLYGEAAKIYLLPGAIFLAIPLYTYHGNHIFSLLFFVLLSVLFFKKYKSSVMFWFSIAIFAVLALLIYSQTLFLADKTKISGLSALGDQALVYEKITINRPQHNSTDQLISTLLHNKVLFMAQTVAQNYLRSFSPEFLFITGGGNTQHNIPDFGNLYLWAAPFLLLGVIFLFFTKLDYKNLIVAWILIAPVAASITKDAPHTNRMASFLPVAEMIVAFGFLNFLNYFKSKGIFIRRVMMIFLPVLFLFNFLFWWDRYFIHFPLKRADKWGEGYSKLISYLNSNNNFDASEIVMTRPDYSPYIYFLYYNKVDPLYYQNSAQRYAETKEGFQHVAGFGNYKFRAVGWFHDLAVPDRLYIDWSPDVSKKATNSAILITRNLIENMRADNKDVSDLNVGDIIRSKKVGEIKLSNDQSMFTLIKTYKSNL